MMGRVDLDAVEQLARDGWPERRVTLHPATVLAMARELRDAREDPNRGHNHPADICLTCQKVDEFHTRRSGGDQAEEGGT